MSPKFKVGDTVLSGAIFVHKIVKITNIYTVDWIGTIIDRKFVKQERFKNTIIKESFEGLEGRSRLFTCEDRAMFL